MFQFAFRLIKQRILERCPAIQQVSWYVRAMFDENGVPLYQLPIVLIEFQPVQLESRSGVNVIQQGDLTFRLHLIEQLDFSEDCELAPLDHLDELYRALHGYAGMLSHLPEFVSLKGDKDDVPIFASLARRSIVPDHLPVNVMSIGQDFTARATDPALLRQIIMRRPSLDSTVELSPAQ